MKKILSFAFLLALSLGITKAQTITKPVKGDLLFELSASGINELGVGLNATKGGLMIRQFTADNKARRLAANLDLQFELFDTLKINSAFSRPGKKRFNEISLSYGMENHMKGSKRMSTYWGYAGGLKLASTDYIALSGGAFTGFDYYLADGLYIGSEVGYNAFLTFREYGQNALGFSIPGATINGAFRMGYRF
ncbi:MAG: hypothetical protein ACKO2X_07635 [Bacteroidota bacterium]